MRLLRYRVTNFRSVEDSGWIECDDVTTLVGINESGKSNLLLALWKLNPASSGKIDILHDLPVSKLSTLRNHTATESFIEAVFNVDEETINNVFDETGYRIDNDTEITVKRYYNGKYNISYSTNPIFEEPDDEEDVEDRRKWTHFKSLKKQLFPNSQNLFTIQITAISLQKFICHL